MITSKYIVVILFPDIVQIYDGPSDYCGMAKGYISSSFGIRITIAKSESITRKGFLFCSTTAPVLNALSYKYNFSGDALYNVLTLPYSKWNPVVLWIDSIYWHGWSGMMCEFGGIWFDSLLTTKVEAGPFCDKFGLLDTNLIVRREFYLYRAHIVLYGFRMFFDMQVLLHVRRPSKEVMTLPFYLPIDTSMKRYVGLLSTESDSAGCTYSFSWHNRIALQIEVLPLCVPSPGPFSLKLSIFHSDHGKTMPALECNHPDIDICAKPDLSVYTIFGEYFDKSLKIGTEYLIKSSCCWLKPVLKIMLTLNSIYMANDTDFAAIQLVPEFSIIMLHFLRLSKTILIFDGTKLGYMQLKVEFPALSYIQLNTGIDSPCARHHAPNIENNDNHVESFVWKSHDMHERFDLEFHSNASALPLNISYSIHNYASLANDWENVLFNRVFISPYNREHNYDLHHSILTIHRELKYIGTGW